MSCLVYILSPRDLSFIAKATGEPGRYWWVERNAEHAAAVGAAVRGHAGVSPNILDHCKLNAARIEFVSAQSSIRRVYAGKVNGVYLGLEVPETGLVAELRSRAKIDNGWWM